MHDVTTGSEFRPDRERAAGRGRARGRRAVRPGHEPLAAVLETLESRSMLAASTLDVTQVMWNGKLVEAVRDEFVLRMPQLNVRTARSPLDYQCRTPAVQAGWSVKEMGAGFFKLTAPGATAAQVNSWSRQVGARYVQANAVFEYMATPNDPLYADPGNWAFPRIRADQAWDTATGTRSTVVAVLDSGVDYNHPDLTANMWRNPGETAGDGIDNDRNGYVDDVFGINAATGTSDPMDTFGHGTFCAGLVGAVGNNAVGMAGVNWSVQVMAVACGDAAGPTLSGIIGGANYIAAQRASGQNIAAVNCSFGGPGFNQAMFDAFKLMGDSGIVVVCAAGNASSNNDTNPTYPANFDVAELISVAASDLSDQLTSFSNFGARTVDLAAPGANVLSTIAAGADPAIWPSLPTAAGYGLNSGTSFAAPLVAGTAGLLKSIKPTASAGQIKSAILGGVDKVSNLAGLVLTGGRLNVANAVTLLNSTTGASPTASFRAGQGLKFLEGDAGFGSAEVTVVLDRPCDPGKTAAVWFETQGGGSAFSGSDFIGQAGFVTFSGGETEKSIRIQLVGDRTPELDETFTIKLAATKSKGVAIGNGTATVTVLDDDNTPNPVQPGGTNPLVPTVSLALKPELIREGGNATFVISLDRTSPKTISVKYRTSQPVLLPAGVAQAGVDYTATSGTMTFRPGERTKEFTVSILADRVEDPQETFNVVLTEPVNAELGSGTAGTGSPTSPLASAVTATILDVPYLPPPAAGFQISLVFPGQTLTPAQQAVFRQAATRWEQIIVGDLPNVTDPFTGQVIDDIVIRAFATPIDGPRGVLGQAGPTELRRGTRGLPWEAVMEFDSADIPMMQADGMFRDVILHEMGHALGFGALWLRQGLTSTGPNGEPIFVGANALREYRAVYNAPAAYGIPLDPAAAHWSESVFGDELMTPFASAAGTRMPISRVTIGQFQDLGYQVNYAPAEGIARSPLRSGTPAAVGAKPGGSPLLMLVSGADPLGGDLVAAAAGSSLSEAAGRGGSGAARRAFAALGRG